jgi:hypothetical protein
MTDLYPEPPHLSAFRAPELDSWQALGLAGDVLTAAGCAFAGDVLVAREHEWFRDVSDVEREVIRPSSPRSASWPGSRGCCSIWSGAGKAASTPTAPYSFASAGNTREVLVWASVGAGEQVAGRIVSPSRKLRRFESFTCHHPEKQLLNCGDAAHLANATPYQVVRRGTSRPPVSRCPADLGGFWIAGR